VHGTTEQIAIAESLARELVPQAGQAPDDEFKLSSGDLVHVYYLPHTANVQDFQAVVTTIRSITDVRRFFTYNARRAAVVRGTQTQMGMTEWLVQQLDQPTSAQSAPAEYRVPGTGDDVVHVYYAKHVDTQQSLQEMASVVRSIGNIRRLFATLNPRAVALRGTSDEMALADFLFQQLDQPTSGPSQSGAAAEYLMSGSGGNVVQVFHLNSVTIQGFQSLATEVRAMANAPQVIPYNARGALALRGTADQIAAAKGLIDERVKR
jgi:type II secretory pathway component GspD/PulD (secretin)